MRLAFLALRRDILSRLGWSWSAQMSVIGWPGWLRCEGTAGCGGSVEWIFCCLSKFFKNVHGACVPLISPMVLFSTPCTNSNDSVIIYVSFVESQVMWCFICLVSPVLVKVYDVLPWYVWAGEPRAGGGGGVTLGIFGWDVPLGLWNPCSRASSAASCYPILE